MAGVEEVREGIALCNEKTSEGIAALQQAVHVLEEAQQALATAIQGSAQDEMQQAYGMLAEVTQTIGGAQGTLNACISSTESYAGRL